MDINKKTTNKLFTMNGEHTLSSPCNRVLRVKGAIP